METQDTLGIAPTQPDGWGMTPTFNMSRVRCQRQRTWWFRNGVVAVPMEHKGGGSTINWLGRTSDYHVGLTKSRSSHSGAPVQRLSVRGIPCWAEMARSMLGHWLGAAQNEDGLLSKPEADPGGTTAGDCQPSSPLGGWQVLFFFEEKFRQYLWLPQKRTEPRDIPPLLERASPLWAAHLLDSPRASYLGVAYFSNFWSGLDTSTSLILIRPRTRHPAATQKLWTCRLFPSCAASS